MRTNPYAYLVSRALTASWGLTTDECARLTPSKPNSRASVWAPRPEAALQGKPTSWVPRLTTISLPVP
jgi:hypothetical protein